MRSHARTAPLRVAALAFVAFVAFAGSLAAQTVRGTVLWPDSTPAAGAIVVARGSGGGTLTRALAGSRGEYVLRLPGAGRYEVTVLRIGFRPTPVPAFDIAAGETRTITVVLRAEPVRLSTVRVRENSPCLINPDSGLMVARAWEAARNALITTRLSPGGAPLVAEWVEYDRTLDASARYVRAQEVHTSRYPTTHAFQSVPAERLSAEGYVTDTMAYAPDADVLLSESFAASHCFRLVTAPPDQPGMIGVGFEPTRARDAVRDIAGTFWIDSASAELRSLEFRYTRLPPVAMAAGSGGSVRFLRLSDGEWLVAEWSVRVARLGMSYGAPPGGLGLPVPNATSVVSFHVTGGAVTRVSRGDTLLYEAPGSALAVQVVARDSLVAAAGARLTLDGTDYAATADAQGRITLSPVLEGRFVARVSTPLMDSLGVAAIEQNVSVGGPAHVDSVALPSAHDVLVAVCPRDSVRHGEAMLRGTVRDARARGLKQAAVTVTWQQNRGSADDGTERTIGTLNDASGTWRICGVPRGTPLAVRVVSDSGADARTLQLADDQSLGVADLAPRAVAVEAGSRSTMQRALVEFAVSGPGGSPLSNATLEVSAPDGTRRTVVTTDGGRALLPDVPPGLLRLRARHIGFKPGEVAVRVEAGRNTVPILLATTSLPSLDTARIMGDRRIDARFDEFETRHLRHEATASLDHDEIVKRDPLETWQLFRTMPGIKMMRDSLTGAMIPMSSRGFVYGTTGGLTPCTLSVFIDGVAADPTFDLRELPPARELHGVEVFAGAASIPLRYAAAVMNDKTCGVIAIWRQ